MTTVHIGFITHSRCFRLLYRRAARIRRLTGEPRFKSMAEIEGEDMTVGEIAQMTLVRPFVLGFKEPIVAFWNVYISLVYGTWHILTQPRIILTYADISLKVSYTSSSNPSMSFSLKYMDSIWRKTGLRSW